MGGSLVKDIFGCEIFYKNDKVVVKLFGGSTTEDRRSYIKLPSKCDPNHFIIHADTNGLRSSKDPGTVGKNVIDIAKNIKSGKNEVLISSIVSGRCNLNGKDHQVNKWVKFFFIYVGPGNIKPRQYCNYGGIHLNTGGNKIMADNFILTLSRET